MARRARKSRAGLQRWDQMVQALRLMNFAFTNVRTYPVSHPEVTGVVARLLDTLAPIVDEQEDVGFGFMDALLYIEGAMSLEETANNQMLVDRFSRARVKYLTIAKGVTQQDLVGFFQVVNLESLKPTTESRNDLLERQGVRHVHIVEAELDDAASRSKAVRRKTLLDWYEKAVSTLGEAQRGLRDGASADLKPLFRLVEDMMATIRNKGPEPYLLLPVLARGVDPHLGHAVNVGVLCCALGDQYGLNSGQISTLCTMAFLHDLGRVIIPPEWAEEPIPLSPEEKEVVRQHADWGFLLLCRNAELAPQLAVLAGRHHDAAAGPGYAPDVYHRLLAVADAYDLGLAGDAYYWKKQRRDRVMRMLLARAGTSFDPLAVKLLANCVGFHPVGSLVELDDGQAAVVVRPNPGHAARPRVWLLDAAEVPAGEAAEEPPPVVADLLELADDGLSFRRSIRRGLDPARRPDLAARLERKKDFLLSYSL